MSDIDDLLDGALEEFDEQTQKQEEERTQREAQADKILETSDMSETDAKLMEAVQGLIGSLAGGQEQSTEQLDGIHNQLQSVIEELQRGNTNDEEADQLRQCTQMLNGLQTADSDGKVPTEEELKAMQATVETMLKDAGMTPEAMAGGAPGQPGAAPGPQLSPEEQQKQLEALLKGLEASAAEGAGTGVAGEAPNMDADAGVAEMLRTMLDPEVIGAPFRALKEHYPQWLEDNASTLSSEELEGFRKQSAKATEIAELLEGRNLKDAIADNAEDADKDSLQRFVALVEEMQGLGEPPASLSEHIQKLAAESAAK